MASAPFLLGVLVLCATAASATTSRSHRFKGGFYPLMAWRVLRLERDVSRTIMGYHLPAILERKALGVLTELINPAWFSDRRNPVRLTLTPLAQGVRLVLLEETGTRHSLTIRPGELHISYRHDNGFTRRIAYRAFRNEHQHQQYLHVDDVKQANADRRTVVELLDAHGNSVEVLPSYPLGRYFDRRAAWPVALPALPH